MYLKPLFVALSLSTALIAPALAQAKAVDLHLRMSNYGGPGAYVAIYVTGPTGAYAGSLWMAGQKTKYYKHLRDWVRYTSNNSAEVSGISGASLGMGRSLDLSMELSDALFDAGYTLHLDAAAEDMRESPNEVEIALTTSGAGQAVSGKTYISTVSYDFK
jgi:hypothetical protein|tara:strand:- start:3172 stop:3651 length:480 start_codon:yes stop_codon:yes gene_type:complete